MHRGDMIRRTHHHHVVRARTFGACRARLISLKPGANNKLSAAAVTSRGHKVYYSCLGESIILFTARVGVHRVGVPDTRRTSDERMDEHATYVCVGRGFLPGTETQNSRIETIKGTVGQRRRGESIRT